MAKEERFSLHTLLLWLAIALLLILSYKIISPFLIPLISAFILAYLARPLFLVLAKKINSHVSAIICLLVIIGIIIIPLGSLIGGITKQAYNSLGDGKLNAMLESLSQYPLLQNFNLDISSLRDKGLEFIINLVSSAASYLPALLLSLLITLISVYYILLNWEKLSKLLIEYLPFKNKKEISREIALATKAILYGTLAIALIEAIVAGIFLAFIGVPTYLLLAALISLLAFIPGLGPGIVWVPLAIYYLLIQSYGQAIAIIILGIILSAGIDAFLRIKILGSEAKIHPLIMLIGILGGVLIFGIFGFIIGPLVLLYTIKLIKGAIKHYS